MLALFDIDGTLLLAGGAGSRTLDKVFADSYGVEGAMHGIRCAGKTDPLIVGELFQAGLGRAPTDDELWTLLAAYEAALPASLASSERFRLMPAVQPALEATRRRGAVLGIATGNTAAGARAKLQHAGLDHHFVVGGYGSDHSDRAVLVRAAIERGEKHASRRFERREVLVIGDTPSDVSAARANDVVAVAVATGSYSREDLEATEADHVIDTLAELDGILG